jgi:hypothetical protein
MNRIIFITLLVFSTKILVAQKSVSGVVRSITKDAVNGVNVTISDFDNDNILGYAIADGQGKYKIVFSTNASRVQIKVRGMNYQTEEKIIDNKSQTIDFELISKATELKEVIVKVPPIRQFGDTLSYNVQSFSGKNDRSIADVLSRMPGIDIMPDGKVLYQGKPINKYYIEGLDLLEGKYNLANKNLPFGQVADVQIFENHQPIRVLDSLVFSDKAALNIRLKNKISFTGLLKAGIGGSPTLYEGNFTPMLFSPKQQMISSYQANNTGENITNQLKNLTLDDLIDNLESSEKPRDWLEIQSLRTPNIPEKRWLDNRSHLLTTNYLCKLNKNSEVRINASYLDDYQQQIGSTKTVFFVPNQDVVIQEEKQNGLYAKSLQTNLTFLKNANNSYFKNSLSFKGFWDSQTGNIMLNNSPIFQNLSNRYFEGSNKLKAIFAVGKQLVTLSSFVGITNTPQNLNIQVQQVNNLFEGEIELPQITQEVLLNAISTDNSLSLTKAWKNFVFIPKLGFQIEDQTLNSLIFNETEKIGENDYTNQLDWNKFKIYFEQQTQFTKGKLKADFKMPLSYNWFDISDANLQKGQKISKIFADPKLSVFYDLSPLWRINSSAGISNQFGAINKLYYGYIIKNYRSVQRIDSPLPIINNQNFNVGISFKNPVISLFTAINYTYVRSKNNLLYINKISENGSNTIQSIEKDNFVKSHIITSRFSKSVHSIKANIIVGSTISINEFPQVINTKEIQITNINNSFNLELTSDFSKFIDVSYRIDLLFANSRIQESRNEQIININQKVNINTYFQQHQLGVEISHFKNQVSSQNTTNFFSDLMYRYTFPKQKIDIELRYNNIFNTDNFIRTTVDSFTYVENNYRLRPSQMLIKVTFPL